MNPTTSHLYFGAVRENKERTRSWYGFYILYIYINMCLYYLSLCSCYVSKYINQNICKLFLPLSPTETNACASQSAGGRYRRIARDASPVFDPMDSLTQGSRLLCASECDRREGCESFSHSGDICKLFSTVDIWDLNRDPGTNVYNKAYPCC